MRVYPKANADGVSVAGGRAGGADDAIQHQHRDRWQRYGGGNGGRLRFESRDEFYGICVENMLASEKGWMLRMHHGDDPAAYVKSLSWPLTRDPYHAAMFRLYADMRGFFRSMAGLATTFNPFNDWLGATGGRL